MTFNKGDIVWTSNYSSDGRRWIELCIYLGQNEDKELHDVYFSEDNYVDSYPVHQIFKTKNEAEEDISI